MKLAEEARKELPKGIYKRGSIYWIRYAGLDGKIVFESSGSTKIKDAQDKLHERKADILRGKQPEITKKIPMVTFKELSVDYLKWAERQRGYRQKATLVAQLVGIFGHYPLRHFSTKLLETWQTERLQQGATRKTVKKGFGGKRVVVDVPGTPRGNAPATINRLLATIKHMITKAVEWEMVEEESLRRVRRVRLLEENNRRLRYLSQEECQALIDASGSHIKPMVIMALNTGMRRGEILNLQWKNVDLKHGFILLDRTKNGDRREIPINLTLRAALKGISRRLDVPYVFHDPATGRPYGDIGTGFTKACKRAGITDFHFHDLRHTFASHLVMAGVDITTVKELLGHKTLTMTLRYAHLAPSHKVKAVDLLDSTLSKNTNCTKTIQLRG
ncbi:MAG: site-specific integrase [Syntrophorhabdus aromaticivorans]|uniref:Site-specific integrase n=1 Tax=Syntrophorhabdus aromaticivorans TaxID=328301 RepID=A0A971S2B1_9BACT|nr:site-specific integrase [Syntrophorhabdus aromaticivorans]